MPRVLLCQASQYFPSLKVAKILASPLIDFLKESSEDQATLKLSAIPVLADGETVMSPVDLINAIASGILTKEMQSFLVIELNRNASASSVKSSVAIRRD